jgi:hypothetical protein
MKPRAKLEVIRKFEDKKGNWVVCKDKRTNREWTVPEKVFESFRYMGLPPIKDKVELKALEALKGRHYLDISKRERYSIIKDLLESTVDGPIQLLFPNI